MSRLAGRHGWLLSVGLAVAGSLFLLAALIAFQAVLLSLRRDQELSFVVTLVASLLLAPLPWDHYLCLLLVPAAFLAARGMIWRLALPLLS
ncbi:MAG: hypothetical protein H0W00_01345 [Chloroflexi bacterium]|nr:hypothetical protein [Chloroflexota bacterium]